MKKQNWRLSASGNPEVTFLDITPAMAAEALLSNANNRRLSHALVKKYANAMRSGHWHLTHQGIAFYDDGGIADCQHRMAAIVESKCTIKMLVVTGLPKSAAIAIDANRPRSESDRLAISGYGVDQLKSRVAVIRALREMVRGAHFSAAIDSDEMKDILVAVEGELNEILAIAKSTTTRTTHSCFRAAILSAYLHGAAGIDAIRRFCYLVENGTDADKEEVAAIKIRDYLVSLREAHGAFSVRKDIFLRTQRALKAFLDRQQITKLYAPDLPLWTCEFLFSDKQASEAA